MKTLRNMMIGMSLAGIASVGFVASAAAKDCNKFDYTKTPNQYVQVQGVKIAYRTIGNGNGKPPLVLLQHFTGTMDDWDSSLIDELALGRKLYIFDSAGVGASDGTNPDSVAGMATIAEQFIAALNLKQVDMLGFSLGGFITQQILIDHPELIRKAILAGTSPEGAEGLAEIPQTLQAGTKKSEETKRNLKDVLFFTDTEEGKAAGAAFLKRINNHTVDPEKPTSDAATGAQLKAVVQWGSGPSSLASLEAVKQPVLIVNGSNDIMARTPNSFLLFQHLPTSQLSLYPDSGHGSLFQYHELFASQVNTFLDGPR